MAESEWQMCSEAEGEERERYCDVHVLEATDATREGPAKLRRADPRRCVRKFIRSGGDNLHSLYPARSFTSLKQTVAYLTHCWYLKSTESDYHGVAVCYHFVMDRLNAVRQELVSESRKGLEVLQVLLHTVRLYIYMLSKCRHLFLILNRTVGTGEQWFDSVMHDNSTTSCITAALASGRDCATATDTDVDVEGSLSIEEMVAELTCYSLLQRAFHSFARSLDVVLLSGSLEALSPARMPDLLSPEEGHPNPTEGKRRAMMMTIWHFLGSCLRTSNPGRAISLVRNLHHQAVGGGGSALMVPPSLLAMYTRFLPGLALWRLLLMECSANRKEELSLIGVASRLGLSDESRVSVAEDPEGSSDNNKVTLRIVSVLVHLQQEGGNSTRITTDERNRPVAFRLRDGSKTSTMDRQQAYKELERHFAETFDLTATVSFEDWFPAL